jgi:hypothetical protein
VRRVPYTAVTLAHLTTRVLEFTLEFTLGIRYLPNRSVRLFGSQIQFLKKQVPIGSLKKKSIEHFWFRYLWFSFVTYQKYRIDLKGM